MTDPIAPFIQRTQLVDATGAQSEEVNKVAVYYWDASALAWTKATGGAIPGANVNVTNFPATTAVTQSTSPWVISAASLPLPANAAIETGGNLDALVAGLPKLTAIKELVVMDWHAAAALGEIAGASVFTSNGIITNAGVTSRQPICSLGAVNYATGAGVQMSFVSNSAQDGPAGTGILTMAVAHIRADYSAQTEIVTMNGLTPVASTVTDTLFINDMVALTAGNTRGEAVGTILASNAAVNYATILPNECRQYSAYRMIPLGKVFVPNLIIASSVSGAGGQSTMRAVFKSPTSNFFVPSSEVGVQDGTVQIPLIGGRAIPAGTIMGIDNSTSKAASVTGAFIGTLRNA